MISLKKYLCAQETLFESSTGPAGRDLLPAALAVYRATLLETGNCAVEACPALGDELKQHFTDLAATLSPQMDSPRLAVAGEEVRVRLRDWSRRTARHYLEKAREVKELLIVMAHTSDSVGARDQRCAGQLHEITARLSAIASLDDLTEIRASIVKSAGDLKSSIDRMTSEGKADLDRMREQVTTYQARLEEAEELAFRDPLTGARSRLGLESLIEDRIAAGSLFSLAMIDIDAFKSVNDIHGHLVGDELLKQFAAELRSACRSTDVIGRWGGDEFMAVFDCGMAEAESRRDRIRKWVCGNYAVPSAAGSIRLTADASIGLAEYRRGEPMKDLLARADAAMYQQKAQSRETANGVRAGAAH
ncbi:MAG TPA: GGDEF domain-containing protein [Terracidiphilus sp.]|nr:GGDEF domain-containing protein [Terracidiphilus sp.]